MNGLPTWLAQPSGRWWSWLAMATALAAGAVGVLRGTYAAGGSDSYCYVSQATSWLDGSAGRAQTVPFATPWPNVALTLAPAGYVPAPHVPGAIAPICPPGFGVLMAGANAVLGAPGIYALVPVMGVLLVWSTFLVGCALRGPAVGAVAAVLTAASPIFLYQVVQPMSDIPSAAAWITALAAATARAPRWTIAGAAAGLAVMIRPNLAPALLVLGATTWFTTPASARRTALVHVVAGGAPFALATAWAHAVVYGSPFRAGYGSLDQLFSSSHVGPNLTRYATWLTDTQTPFVWLALASPLVALVAARSPAHAGAHLAANRTVALVLSAFAAVVIGIYLPYTVFEDWWYLRFLLPALPAILILASDGGAALLSVVWRPFVVSAVMIGVAGALAVLGVRTAGERSAFDLWRSERRFVTAGEAVARIVPQDGVVWSSFHSGNVRLYGHRASVMWDALPEDWLDRAVSSLAAEGRPSFLVLDSFEEPVFRARFERASPLGALDWPPRVEIGNVVRIWSFEDRARFLAGDPPRTERLAVVPRANRSR